MCSDRENGNPDAATSRPIASSAAINGASAPSLASAKIVTPFCSVQRAGCWRGDVLDAEDITLSRI
jgi:hypothetical protein